MHKPYNASMYRTDERQGFLRRIDSRLIVLMHFGRIPSEELLAKQVAAEAELARRDELVSA